MLTPGDIVKRILLFFVGGSLVVAVLRGFPITEPNQWYAWGEEQAAKTEEWVKGWMGDVPLDELKPVDSIIPSEGATEEKVSTQKDKGDGN